MKKNILYMAAASALMLTACTSEDDILQTSQVKQPAAQEVGFDVYTPAATNVTRAGQAGTMTTGRLQRTEAKGGGFGVYAYLVDDADNTADATSYISWGRDAGTKKAPNFMINEKILWNATNQGWYYNPLKYWPNETNKDSQSTNAEMEAIGGNKHLDRLTFFAYAPYVSAGADEPGITLLTNKKGVLNIDPTSDATGTVVEASVGYKASLNKPSDAVDLLWGVAPAGGLTYTAVNGQSVTVKEGEPLIDMTKPDVNTNMKFLFQHALARIGINVVAAIDQIGAGGKLDENTKITIKQVTLKGKFGETGVLNLDNPTANVAHWQDINGTAITSSTADLPTYTTLTLNVDNSTIAPDLRYDGEHTFGSYSEQTVAGVTTTKKDLLTGRYYTLDAVPTYSPTKQYYSDGNGTLVAGTTATYTFTSTDKIYSFDTDHYIQATGTATAPAIGTTTTTYKSLAKASTRKSNESAPADGTWYTKDGNGIYTYVASPSWDDGSTDENATVYYTVTPSDLTASEIPFAYPSGTYYDVERNYFMVVPTNNVKQLNPGLDDEVEKSLRTVRVMIEYYVTTEDDKVQGKRTQIKNVIEKNVLFPSMANGKSYMLNLVLGLTSVKMDAEVDDWKVINVQGDLPQNTAE
jgi:hypothetical protein